jgi:hypothetical protein
MSREGSMTITYVKITSYAKCEEASMQPAEVLRDQYWVEDNLASGFITVEDLAPIIFAGWAQ